MSSNHITGELAFPQTFNEVAPIFADLTQVNGRLRAAGRDDLEIAQPVTLPEVTTPEQLFETNDFTPKLVRFLPAALKSQPQNTPLDEILYPTDAFDDTMRAYDIAARLLPADYNSREALAQFPNKNIAALALLGFKENDFRANTLALFDLNLTHADKPAFWRMYTLWPELSGKILNHHARHDVSAAWKENPDIFSDPEAFRKARPDPEVGLIAYNIMSRLVDKQDPDVTERGTQYLHN